MDPLIPSETSPSDAGDDPIEDSSTTGFAADVLEASHKVPVIVDFWAPWCGPCKQLGPALEKAVRNARGRIRLVKINVDENKELAAQLRIQSIPTVYAFYGAQPVDGFTGALPESQINQFIEKILSHSGAGDQEDPAEEILQQAAAALEEHDAAQAAELYGRILSHDPSNADAVGGIISCYIMMGETERARQFLDQVPEPLKDSPAISAARTRLDLAEKGKKVAGNTEELTARIRQNPNDHEARFDLALALFAENKQEDAIEALLEILRRDKNWNDEAARKQLLDFFDVLGPSHSLSMAGRRKLSSLLFS